MSQLPTFDPVAEQDRVMEDAPFENSNQEDQEGLVTLFPENSAPYEYKNAEKDHSIELREALAFGKRKREVIDLDEDIHEYQPAIKKESGTMYNIIGSSKGKGRAEYIEIMED